jgi:putative ABC transport system permease protein
VVLVLGVLAVAFGSEVLTFAATYRTAKAADAQAALGSDLRVTPGDPSFTLPPLSPEIASVSPFRLVPARVGGDRKTILTIDLASYGPTTAMLPLMVAGRGPEGLVKNPTGVLVSEEIQTDFALRPGDRLPLLLYPDDFENSTKLDLHVVGVFRSFPPTKPVAELVMSAEALPQTLIVPPDFYLARVAPGSSPEKVATDLRSSLADRFGVTTLGDPTTRGLTALDLGGMSRIESLGAGLIAAVGVAVLGALLVLERRREFAILRTVGADTSQVSTGPATEGAIVVLGSLFIGLPLGVGLGVLAVRVLGLFFTLPPPLFSLPTRAMLGLAGFMLGASAVAISFTVLAVSRVHPASVLREQV